MSMDTSYKGKKISLRTETFGNGVAVEVHVDGEQVLDLYNSDALCATLRAAMDKGFQYGREFVDAKLDLDKAQEDTNNIA